MYFIDFICYLNDIICTIAKPNHNNVLIKIT